MRTATSTGTGRTSAGRPVVVAVILALFLASPVAAQTGGTPAQGVDSAPATRSELESRLDRLQELVSEGATGSEARDARQRMEVIRRRLEEGDFQPGDVVRLTVRSDSSLTGTFQVNAQRSLELPTIPDVSLSGVLYSEAGSVVREHLGEFIRDPEVRVQVTRRIAILGAVQNPGFYDLAPSTTLSDALMAAGGPTGNAKLEGIKLQRDGRNVLEGRDPSLQRMTLADLGPSEDDQLVVPQSGGGFGVLDALGVLSTISGVAWGLTRVF